MNKRGFTLIEVIVSVVLVSVVMVSLLGSLIQLRQTYTVIHENSDVIVYSSSISRVINNDLAANNGIRYCTCAADGQSCDIILGNNQKRELQIIKKVAKENCYNDKVKVDCSSTFNRKDEVIRTTLKYTNTTTDSDNKLIYIRTLELQKTSVKEDGKLYPTNAKGYNFADMSTTTYEHDKDVARSKVDQYTTILIRLNNDINEDISKYDIILYAAGRYDYEYLIGRTFTLELNSNGASSPGTTKIDEVFGVGYFVTEENHTVKNQITMKKPIKIPINAHEGNTPKAFLGYFYRPAGSTQKIQVIDSKGVVISSSRFFKDSIEMNLENNADKAVIIAEWGNCTNGYHIENGACVPQEYTVTLDKNGGTGGTDSYKASYNSWVKDITPPTRSGYSFVGYYLGTRQFHDGNGKGIDKYDIEGDSTLTAKWIDSVAPTATITSTNSLKSTSQTATLTCSDNVGVIGYYWGTSAPTSSSTYTAVTSTTNMNVTKTVSSSGKYYLSCKDANGNVNTAATITYYRYTVYNMLQNVDLSSGYTNENYTQVGSATNYIATSSTTLPLNNIYTVPTGSSTTRFAGASTGTPSANEVTPSKTNPTLNSNTTYTMWFTRNRVYYRYKMDTGESIQASAGGYLWRKGSSSYVERAADSSSSYSTYYQASGYGATSVNLIDYNNTSFVNITKPGFKGKSGSEWKCVAGCSTSNLTISHASTSVNLTSICGSIATSDCTVDLSVNWERVVPSTPTITDNCSSSCNNRWVNSNYTLTVATSTGSSYIGKWYQKVGNGSYTEVTAGAGKNSFTLSQTASSGTVVNKTIYLVACNLAATSATDTTNCSSAVSYIVKIDKEPPVIVFPDTTNAVNNCSAKGDTTLLSGDLYNNNTKIICRFKTKTSKLWNFSINFSCNDGSGSGCKTSSDTGHYRKLIIEHVGGSSSYSCGNHANGTWKYDEECDYGVGGTPTRYYQYNIYYDKVGNESVEYQFFGENTFY